MREKQGLSSFERIAAQMSLEQACQTLMRSKEASVRWKVRVHVLEGTEMNEWVTADALHVVRAAGRL